MILAMQHFGYFILTTITVTGHATFGLSITSSICDISSHYDNWSFNDIGYFMTFGLCTICSLCGIWLLCDIMFSQRDLIMRHLTTTRHFIHTTTDRRSTYATFGYCIMTTGHATFGLYALLDPFATFNHDNWYISDTWSCDNWYLRHLITTIGLSATLDHATIGIYDIWSRQLVSQRHLIMRHLTTPRHFIHTTTAVLIRRHASTSSGELSSLLALFAPPECAGIGLTATLDHATFAHPATLHPHYYCCPHPTNCPPPPPANCHLYWRCLRRQNAPELVSQRHLIMRHLPTPRHFIHTTTAVLIRRTVLHLLRQIVIFVGAIGAVCANRMGRNWSHSDTWSCDIWPPRDTSSTLLQLSSSDELSSTSSGELSSLLAPLSMFGPPECAGIGLTATLDHATFAHPATLHPHYYCCPHPTNCPPPPPANCHLFWRHWRCLRRRNATELVSQRHWIMRHLVSTTFDHDNWSLSDTWSCDIWPPRGPATLHPHYYCCPHPTNCPPPPPANCHLYWRHWRCLRHRNAPIPRAVSPSSPSCDDSGTRSWSGARTAPGFRPFPGAWGDRGIWKRGCNCHNSWTLYWKFGNVYVYVHFSSRYMSNWQYWPEMGLQKIKCSNVNLNTLANRQITSKLAIFIDITSQYS